MTEHLRLRPLRLAGLALAVLSAVPLAALCLKGRWAWPMGLWCRIAGRTLGLRVRIRGRRPAGGALLVANHLGYLDILALGASAPGRFVAKSEISAWSAVGTLAGAAGTIYADRDRPRQSLPLVDAVARRLQGGDRVLLFPEAGVAPDGSTLGSFHTMLFEAAIRAEAPVVPVGLRYTGPDDRKVWAWIEEADLWRHLVTRVLPARRVAVEVRFGRPLRPTPNTDRKALAREARKAVQELLESEITLTDRERP